MGERTRRHVQREAAPTRVAAPTRTTDTDADDRSSHPPNPLLDLQATAGNRAVAELMLQRAPDQTGDNIITVQTQAEAAADLAAAEAWVLFVAVRGNAAAPGKSLPSRYRSQLAIIQAAVGGPGPIPAEEVAATATALSSAVGTIAKAVIARMQTDHRSLLPKEPMEAYVPVDYALEVGEENRKAGRGPASTQEQAVTLLQIRGSAEDEIKLARDGGYDVPKALADLPGQAWAMFITAQKGWPGGGATAEQILTATDETDLDLFAESAYEVVNSVARLRFADIARALRRHEELLRKANDEQMAELTKALAEKRKNAFAANDHGALDDVSEALGSVSRAIGDTREAARIISDRVDQVNAAASMVSKSGKGFISLPEVPGGLTDVAEWLEKANEKVKFVIDVLDLVGPAKNELEGGLKYLKALDMSLKSLGGSSPNPFVSGYVNSYLGPGIQHCVESIGTIAAIAASENRSALEIGEGSRVRFWGVESGGEEMYLFIATVYRMGGAAPVSDKAWEYLSDQRDSFEASVGAPMPKERRAVAAWAAAHKLEIWQSLYGSTKPPN